MPGRSRTPFTASSDTERAVAIAKAQRRRGWVLALTLGVAGGALAFVVALPLPWMLGPMIACAAAALAGVPLVGPVAARPIVVPILGVMLGSAFTPDILNQFAIWAGTFVMLPVFLLAAGAAGWTFYRHVGGYDARTAFFCAAPGGLNEMMLLGAEVGADERRISLAHAVRIFVVIALVALAFALFEGTTSAGLEGAWVRLTDIPARDLAVLLACAVLGATAARKLTLPAAPLFGPMILSALVHLTGVVSDPPPSLLVIVAQVVIGTVLGSRFVGSSLRETGRDLALAAGAALVMLSVAVLFAGFVAWATATPWTQAVLAYSPGGLAEMSLLALAKGQDVAYVSTAHVARIVVVLFAVQPVFRWFAARFPSDGGDERGGPATPGGN